jgi:hypothetical protein
MHDSSQPLPPTAPLADHLRCPHCHNPIELFDDHADEVLCPGCGGSFRVRDARRTHGTDPTRPLGKFQLLQRAGFGAYVDGLLAFRTLFNPAFSQSQSISFSFLVPLPNATQVWHWIGYDYSALTFPVAIGQIGIERIGPPGL